MTDSRHDSLLCVSKIYLSAMLKTIRNMRVGNPRHPIRSGCQISDTKRKKQRTQEHQSKPQTGIKQRHQESTKKKPITGNLVNQKHKNQETSFQAREMNFTILENKSNQLG